MVLRLELCADALNNLVDARVGGCGAVRENQSWNGLVAVVERLDDLRGAFDFFDIHFGVGDTLLVHQALQVAAVAAPAGGEHGDSAGSGNVLVKVQFIAHIWCNGTHVDFVPGWPEKVR